MEFKESPSDANLLWAKPCSEMFLTSRGMQERHHPTPVGVCQTEVWMKNLFEQD